MTEARSIVSGPQGEAGGPAASLLFWALAQVAALAIAAGDLPLVAAQTRPTERWTMLLLVAVQFSAGATFAGPLLGSVQKALINIATAWPMLQLAGLLAGEPQSHVLAASSAVTLWLGGLACWMAAVAGHGRGGPVISALAGAWTLGGAALAYCHADFGSSPGQSVFPTAAWLSPLLGAMEVSTDPRCWTTWSTLAVHCGLALAALASVRVYRRRAKAGLA